MGGKLREPEEGVGRAEGRCWKERTAMLIGRNTEQRKGFGGTRQECGEGTRW